jgi:hypothetical protein
VTARKFESTFAHGNGAKRRLTGVRSNHRHPRSGLAAGCIGLAAACLILLVDCGHAPPPSAGAPAAGTPAASPGADDTAQAAAGFDKLFLHDPCTGPFPPQPDTCAHERRHEKSFTFGGKPGTVYDVTLHVRGIFEPTIIKDGETPYPQHPYFKVGGTVDAIDWSHWHIEVSEPKQTYWLNHYPKFSHTIYKEDYEATIPVAAGATVVVRVIDGNDRQIDNGKTTGPDRQQTIAGVVDKPLEGQMLRLDVVGVKAR